MAEEKMEKKVDEVIAPEQNDELSDADFEKIAGGGHHNTLVSGHAGCS